MKYKILIILILVVAIFTRFYKLGSFPDGLTWDEAAIGYNSYGLITNHRDEWLHRTPIVFQSFGDFKSPLLIYLDMIPVALLGLNPFAVRLPVAVAGVGLVLVSFFLALEIFKEKRVALGVMSLLTLSPWAIHYSRMAFESMLATFLVSTGVLFFLYWVRKRKFLPLALSLLSFAFALYAYHSAKIVVPILAIFFLYEFRKVIWEQKKQVFMGIALTILVLLPLIYASIFGSANARAASTTVLAQKGALTHFATNYISHLSPAFLLRGKDITYRHSTMQIGVLYPVELLFFVLGIGVIVLSKKYRKFWWIPFFFFVGLIPASLGLDVPHSNRALLALPWAQLTAGITVLYIFESIKRERTLQVLAIAIAMLTAVGVVHYKKAYVSVYASSTALHDVGYGYREVMSYVRPEEGNVDRVYFTNTYGQAYIYILFFKELTPMEYQHGGLANYTISEKPYNDAMGKKNVLIVGTAADIPDSANIVKEITYPDGKIAFRIAKQ